MFARNAKQKNDTKRQRRIKLMLFSEKLPKSAVELSVQSRMPSKQKNEEKEILLLDFELFIGGYILSFISVAKKR
jgi:hypothetical protein